MSRTLRLTHMRALFRTGRRRYLAWLLAAGLGGVTMALAPAQPPAEGEVTATLGQPRPAGPEQTTTEPSAEVREAEALSKLLGPDVMPIDLPSALKVAGVNNPQILIARQRVLIAVSDRQYAAAQILPNLNLGSSYDNHNGNLQQSSGNILKVDRENVYFGAGANAIAAGTVSIPGVVWNLNVSAGIFAAVASKAVVQQREFESRAVNNEMLRRVAVAYTELLRAEGAYAVSQLVLAEAQQVERQTEAFARAGQGRQADLERAISERRQRQAELLQADGEVLQASARLAELLTLPPTARLHVVNDGPIPCAVVPDPIPLPELLTIAILNRPELAARQAAIRQTLALLQGAKVLPFSPQVFIGLSFGGEGTGSNLVAQPVGTSPFARGADRFVSPQERLDFDAVAYWALQNLGVGNRALIDAARSRVTAANAQYLIELNKVRSEVASAYARTHARFAQIAAGEQAVRDAQVSYELDSRAVEQAIGRPIELLESLRLLAEARYTYLNSILDYNQAQIDLFVALGQPPADSLARPVPPGFVPPGTDPQSRRQEQERLQQQQKQAERKGG